MSEISSSEYWNEIESIADNLVEETMDEFDNDRDSAEEEINDSRLHETIDGHQWIIYYHYNDDVLKHSDNEDYMQDNLGEESMVATLREKGFDGLKMAVAFYAMYADVQDKLEDAFDKYEEENDGED